MPVCWQTKAEVAGKNYWVDRLLGTQDYVEPNEYNETKKELYD